MCRVILQDIIDKSAVFFRITNAHTHHCQTANSAGRGRAGVLDVGKCAARVKHAVRSCGGHNPPVFRQKKINNTGFSRGRHAVTKIKYTEKFLFVNLSRIFVDLMMKQACIHRSPCNH
jgi:hypothetical protein